MNFTTEELVLLKDSCEEMYRPLAREDSSHSDYRALEAKIDEELEKRGYWECHCEGDHLESA